MKLFKKALFATVLSSFLLSGSLFAQEYDRSQNVIIQGKAAKMTVFWSMPGMADFTLSRNGRFLMGRTDGDIETPDHGGIIYEIATDSLVMTPTSVVEVVDWDNYVTTSFALIDGKEYSDFTKLITPENKLSIEEASADLGILRASLKIKTSADTAAAKIFSNILIDTKTGRILDTIKTLDPTFAGGMNMGWRMSADAKIIGGRASITGANINYAPAFWDMDRDAVYYVGFEAESDLGIKYLASGELWDVNASGTRLCGEIHGRPAILTYDKNTGEWERELLDVSVGYDQGQAFRMNERGIVLGTEQIGIDFWTRRAFLYDINTKEKSILSEYLKNLYGLECEPEVPLFTPRGITDDGRYIFGFTYDDGTFISYMIELNEHQIYAPVRNIQAQAVPRRSSNIEVSWQAPLKGEYTLTGYKIFRDKELISTVLPSELSFKEENVPNGKRKYFVQAVYGDSVSAALDTVSIFVVDPNGCLPVQELFFDVEYNRTVSLCWGLPSDQESSNLITRPKGSAPKYIPKEGLDFVSVFQPFASRMSTGIRIGDYIYAGSYVETGIFVYDLFGNTIKHISINGVGNIYDMTYHDGTFYVATGHERVVQVKTDPDDPFNFTSGNFITTSFGKTISIAYVENDDASINNGEDYLIVGNYTNLVAYPTDAVNFNDEFKLPVDINIDGMLVAGTEYYKGRLYLSNQNGTNGCDLIAYDMTTGEKIFTTDLYAHPVVDDAAHSLGWPEPVYAGGLIHATLPDGTEVLECLLQCQYTYNMIVDMELESAEEVLGYVVYRNGEKITDTLKARHFTEVIDEPGKYTYHIEYISTRGCSSSSTDADVTRTIEIFEKGNCSAPAELTVYESDKKAVLSWSDDCFYRDGFVGFNLYRNGEQIGEKRFLDVRYTDSEVEFDTKYEYRLEAFYNTSCVASITDSIILTGKGAAREPGGFSVEGSENADNTIKSNATWTMPYFEEPMAYGYCGVPSGSTYVSESSQIFCIVGWNYEDMDKFEDDLYLVGVEFMLGVPSTSKALKSLNMIVYVNDQLVYNKPYEERFQAKQWKRAYFDQVFKMKQRSEIAVGYSVSYDPSAFGQQEGAFVFDAGPRKAVGKADLISMDGKEFTTLY
ncbi:MAG: fibronectin type III domain-containing protein, partial [Bacteroidales bacterium]|nr:fibronectin type III domain-containing protein [Bacteroidales bacterium]